MTMAAACQRSAFWWAPRHCFEELKMLVQAMAQGQGQEQTQVQEQGVRLELVQEPVQGLE
jgi:hypothetical protein